MARNYPEQIHWLSSRDDPDQIRVQFTYANMGKTEWNRMNDVFDHIIADKWDLASATIWPVPSGHMRIATGPYDTRNNPDILIKRIEGSKQDVLEALKLLRQTEFLTQEQYDSAFTYIHFGVGPQVFPEPQDGPKITAGVFDVHSDETRKLLLAGSNVAFEAGMKMDDILAAFASDRGQSFFANLACAKTEDQIAEAIDLFYEPDSVVKQDGKLPETIGISTRYTDNPQKRTLVLYFGEMDKPHRAVLHRRLECVIETEHPELKMPSPDRFQERESQLITGTPENIKAALPTLCEYGFMSEEQARYTVKNIERDMLGTVSTPRLYGRISGGDDEDIIGPTGPPSLQLPLIDCGNGIRLEVTFEPYGRDTLLTVPGNIEPGELIIRVIRNKHGDDVLKHVVSADLMHGITSAIMADFPIENLSMTCKDSYPIVITARAGEDYRAFPMDLFSPIREYLESDAVGELLRNQAAALDATKEISDTVQVESYGYEFYKRASDTAKTLNHPDGDLSSLPQETSDLLPFFLYQQIVQENQTPDSIERNVREFLGNEATSADTVTALTSTALQFYNSNATELRESPHGVIPSVTMQRRNHTERNQASECYARALEAVRERQEEYSGGFQDVDPLVLAFFLYKQASQKESLDAGNVMKNSRIFAEANPGLLDDLGMIALASVAHDFMLAEQRHQYRGRNNS